MAASKTSADFAWACDIDQLNALPGPVENFLDYHNFDNFGDPSYNGTNAWPTDLSVCTDNPVLVNLSWAGLCERLGGEWSRPLVHYDDVFRAYLALVQVATFEGWMEVMDASIDAPLIVCLLFEVFDSKQNYWWIIIISRMYSVLFKFFFCVFVTVLEFFI